MSGTGPRKTRSGKFSSNFDHKHLPKTSHASARTHQICNLKSSSELRLTVALCIFLRLTV